MVKVEDLDNPEKVKETDPSEMLAVVAQTPEMMTKAGQISPVPALRKSKKISQILVAGMGGSAISGDIMAGMFFFKSSIPILVNRDYRLPAFAGKETLVLALSYSGNTEETLHAVKEAERAGAKIVCVTSGGKLKEIAESKGYPLYLLPSGFQPRAALPYLLIPALKALEGAGVVSGIQDEIKKAGDLLRKLRGEYGTDRPLRSNPAKQLAKKLMDRIPVIFASSVTTEAAGLRLKTQFNENSKVTALFGVFPELNHNEIVNLSTLKREEHDFSLILLRDEGDFERTKKRMEITKSLLGTQLGGVNEIWSQGKTPLERVLSLIFFGDFLSVYLAILRDIDPTPVDVITRLKKELAR